MIKTHIRYFYEKNSKYQKNFYGGIWFTSIVLALGKLLTIVGTVKADKLQIPPMFLKITKVSVSYKMYGCIEKLTLLPYVPKKSSFHGNCEIIKLYIITKGST